MKDADRCAADVELTEDRTGRSWMAGEDPTYDPTLIAGEQSTGEMRGSLSFLSPIAAAGGGIRTVDVLPR